MLRACLPACRVLVLTHLALGFFYPAMADSSAARLQPMGDRVTLFKSTLMLDMHVCSAWISATTGLPGCPALCPPLTSSPA